MRAAATESRLRRRFQCKQHRCGGRRDVEHKERCRGRGSIAGVRNSRKREGIYETKNMEEPPICEGARRNMAEDVRAGAIISGLLTWKE